MESKQMIPFNTLAFPLETYHFMSCPRSYGTPPHHCVLACFFPALALQTHLAMQDQFRSQTNKAELKLYALSVSAPTPTRPSAPSVRVDFISPRLAYMYLRMTVLSS